MTNRRTEIEREANMADCELYRVISRIERLYDSNKRDKIIRANLGHTLNYLRNARFGLRMLMHADDAARTAPGVAEVSK